MITEIYKKLKSSYVGSILGDLGGFFSRKRIHVDDSSDEDDDPILIEPPFKRNKFFCSDVDSNIRAAGLQKYDKFLFGSDHQSTKPSYSCSPNMSRLKGSLDHDPCSLTRPAIRSALFPDIKNKENKSTENTQISKNDIEYLGISSKSPFLAEKFYGKGINKDSDAAYQSPFASFRFSPSVTSTVDKAGASKIQIAKRKPIKASHLSSEKVLSRTPTKFDIKKRHLDSLIFKSRPSKKSLIESLMPSGIGPFLTAKQSYRLEDRERYRQVLQQFTSSDVTSQNSWKKHPFPSIHKRNLYETLLPPSSGGAILTTTLDPISTCRNRKKWEKCEDRPTPSLPLSCLRDSVASTNKSRNATTLSEDKKSDLGAIPLIDLEAIAPTEEGLKDSVDDDIIITKEIKAPKKIISSLETRLQKSPFYNDDWLKNFRQYYRDKKSDTEADVQAVYEAKKECEQSRRGVEEKILEKVAKRISDLNIEFPKRVVELKDEEEVFELTPEMERTIEKAFRGGPPSQVLADKFNIQITRRDLYTLAGLNWLNDEVINFYMNMLMERGKNDNYPSVYAFNTFFYSKLVKTGYSSVKRWTKKVNIFSSDLLVIPVHLGMHWCLATIDLRNKSICYYDSMLGDNFKCLTELKNYLVSEHQDKKQLPFDVSQFSVENVKDIPQQMNGSDCGMFSCKFAEYLSRDAKITFSQEHMPYFRQRMVYEIVTQKLL